MKKKINYNVILFLFPILILIGKIVRWTIMKEVLVDEGSGHGILQTIVSGNLKFTFLQSDSATDTFGNVAYIFSFFYKYFGIKTYIGFEIFISIICNIILLIFILNSKNKTYSIGHAIFLMLMIMVLNIFDFCLAKEPFQLVYFIMIYLVLKSNRLTLNKKYVYSLLILFLSVITFRKYYILVIFFTILFKFLCKSFIEKKNEYKLYNLFFIILIIFLTFIVFLIFAKNLSYSDYKELLRVRLRTSSAASDMRGIFNSTNVILFSLDYIIMLLRMLFPVELLRLGVKYFFYVFYQLCITMFLFKIFKNIKKIGENQKVALYIFVGFILASACFEPDFGSWIRHEAITFPILFILFDNNIENDKYQEN